MREVTVTQFSFGGTNQVTGPANPIDTTDSVTEVSISFDVSSYFGMPLLITNLESSTRINAVILNQSNLFGVRANTFIQPPGGVKTDSNFTLDSFRPFTEVTFCYGDSFARQDDDPLDLCEPEQIPLDGCDILGLVAGGETELCACSPEFARVCDPGAPVNVGGCGILEVEDLEPISVVKGSSCVCRSTNRGTRCFGNC